jgi:hypothetical protein
MEVPKKWLDRMFAVISTNKSSFSSDDSDFEDVPDREKCSQHWDSSCMQGW